MKKQFEVGGKTLTMHNRSILLDVSHVAKAGDEQKMGSLVVGIRQTSEVPTYGKVVAVSDDLLDTVEVGSIISIPLQGILRTVEWPGKDEKLRLVSMRMEHVDVIVK